MKKILLFAAALLFLHPVKDLATENHSFLYANIMKGTPGLKIDFISKGAGIDHESFDRIEAYLKAHPKKPSYTVNAFGKEGEKSILVTMTELSKKEQKALEKDIQKLIVKKDMVTVKKIKKIRAAF